MFVDMLRRTVASTGGSLTEVPTRSAKLSQWCHGCGKTVKKPLSQRWHTCPCGVGPVQRDLYSAFLAAYLDPEKPIPSCAGYVIPWEGAQARLRAAHERVRQLAPKLWLCQSRSASAQKSKRTHTRAFFPPSTRQAGSVDGTLEPPVCLNRGALSYSACA
jgi:hypothetical protein